MIRDYPTTDPSSRGTTASGPNGRAHKPAAPGISAKEVREFVKPIEELITKYPAAALASAFLVGVVLAWWVKRK
jgi:hypothetical protein